MSESPYNPVAAALGNAIRDATGVRYTTLPFKPDRIFELLPREPLAGVVHLAYCIQSAPPLLF